MFIFSNVFELLHSYIVPEQQQSVYPALKILTITAPHLLRSIFDFERSFVDDHILNLTLRSQLYGFLDYKFTQNLFGLVFLESYDKKVSVFEDSFNP